MNNKRLYYLACGTIALSIGLLLYVYYLLFWPPSVIHVNQQPYKIMTPIVHAGDRVIYLADICKYVDAVSNTQRAFVGPGGVVTTVAPVQTNLKKGCAKSLVSVLVPPKLTPGRTYLSIGLSYDVNALRKDVTYHLRTDWFTVVQ